MLKCISELEELARELSDRVKKAAPEQYQKTPYKELDPVGRDWMDAVACADEACFALADLRWCLTDKLEALGVDLTRPPSQAGHDGGAAERQPSPPRPDADSMTAT